MRILWENLTEFFEFLFGKIFRQTLETRNKERLQDSKELVIAYVFSIEFRLPLLNVEENII